MKPILEVQGLSKRYNIRHESGNYLSLRERLTDFLRPRQGVREEFWALQDVSFDVRPGESIGILGRNGAGKSTLLKTLSRITPPSKGRFIARGRIASLLEVGTGFHPELTGRENIFFNGSLLGMKGREIADKFDEIVEFSGVEKFLDTPLKHYSSGMQLRLAFSVAAFLEPEILIIDEVLAVGDAEFQNKCMGKMESVSMSGRTIIFVSHNMAAIANLCSRAIHIQAGKVFADGNSDQVIRGYMTSLSSGKNAAVLEELFQKTDDDYLAFRKIEIKQEGFTTDLIQNSKEIEVSIQYLVKRPIRAFQLSIDLMDQLENVIFKTFQYEVGKNNAPGLVEPGEYLSIAQIPKDILIEGNYKFVVRASNMYERMIEPRDGISINISVDEAGRFVRKIYHGNKGMLTVDVNWKTRKFD